MPSVVPLLFIPGACAMGFGVAGANGALLALEAMALLLGIATACHLVVGSLCRDKPSKAAANSALSTDIEQPISQPRVGFASKRM